MMNLLVFSKSLFSNFQKVLFSLGGSFLYYADRFKIYSAFCASHTKVPKVLTKGNAISTFRTVLKRKSAFGSSRYLVSLPCSMKFKCLNALSSCSEVLPPAEGQFSVYSMLEGCFTLLQANYVAQSIFTEE